MNVQNLIQRSLMFGEQYYGELKLDTLDELCNKFKASLDFIRYGVNENDLQTVQVGVGLAFTFGVGIYGSIDNALLNDLTDIDVQQPVNPGLSNKNANMILHLLDLIADDDGEQIKNDPFTGKKSYSSETLKKHYINSDPSHSNEFSFGSHNHLINMIKILAKIAGLCGGTLEDCIDLEMSDFVGYLRIEKGMNV
ncbi:hypothetical protein [Xylocopilactobacillus apicola]|uniref:Transcriptional regulator n=1 Tax=Xylocopilactobacillus apicola TaxID=2932184 RepID=A0AAU9DLW2_9LACO|nr:hypothetical protein [Xylocopilactobacillus apicola]BDR59551.1 hypothetical protein XA3_19920 [Xylocopilactobacillus apicola]